MVKVPDFVAYDSKIVMDYIQEFANLTEIPHPSGHTERMTAYLLDWAAARGVRCEAEPCGNVVMDVPASPGFEGAPLVAFQGHIDMVPATDEGVMHDWVNDPLDLLWTPNSVKANGTTLGADNGSGVAFMLAYIAHAGEYVHGPLRFLFTVDEEVGLLGAAALDAQHVAGVRYLINVDGGSDGAVVSCAGGKYFTFSRAAKWEALPADTVIRALSISGLTGGHSANVGGGKANALVAAANALLALNQAGIGFQLAGFEGGDAPNAIPNACRAVVALRAQDAAAADARMAGFAKLFRESYEAVEQRYLLEFAEADAPDGRALDAEISLQLARLMSAVPDGIHTLRPNGQGTECSSNLGVVRFDEDAVGFTCFMRSSSNYQAEQITWINAALAELTGFALEIPVSLSAWPLKAGDRLGEIAAQLYREQTGGEYRLTAIHAGVECGELAGKNPEMSIISTGISGGSGEHTPAEAMNFDQVEQGVRFLTALAQRLAEMG